MAKPRNKRSDSATAAVEAHRNVALGPREPLEHAPIQADARPFWDAIMRNRGRDRWNDADLANAAILARCQYLVTKLQAEVMAEGDVVDGKPNPKHKLIEANIRLAMSMARMLHVHPEATEGRSRNATGAVELERDAAAIKVSRLIPRGA